MLPRIVYITHFLTLTALACILGATFYFQLTHHELPCPLCLFQRMGVIIIALGFLLNLRFGYAPSHYAIALLGAIFTMVVAGYQVLVHILPGDPGYGDTFLSLHFYTLAFIAALGFTLLTSLLLLLNRQFIAPPIHTRSKVTWLFNSVFFFLILANIVSTFLECKLSLCPSNPVKYELLDSH